MKRYLGIEGVHLEIRISDEATNNLPRAGKIEGLLRIASLQPQVIEELTITLTERYVLGRAERRSIETFKLGNYSEKIDLAVEANEEILLPFSLTYATRQSPIERFVGNNVLLKPLRAIANKTINASSTYALTASAKVKGVRLDPKTSVEVFINS